MSNTTNEETGCLGIFLKMFGVSVAAFGSLYWGREWIIVAAGRFIGFRWSERIESYPITKHETG
jgi:hypothetical protein